MNFVLGLRLLRQNVSVDEADYFFDRVVLPASENTALLSLILELARGDRIPTSPHLHSRLPLRAVPDRIALTQIAGPFYLVSSGQIAPCALPPKTA
jgi:hypothetical protein